MMRSPTLRLTDSYSSATTYTFHVEGNDFGWAICTVNDRTGELMIVSDWGNWSYLWGTKHLGVPTLTEFIGNPRRAQTGDYDYLANKLLGRQDCWVIDADATIDAWRKKLCEKRYAEGHEATYWGRRPDDIPVFVGHPFALTKYHARELWDELGRLHEYAYDERGFIDAAMRIEGIGYVSEQPWEDVQHRHSNDYRILTETILPALCEACELEAKTRPRTSPPQVVAAAS